MALLGGLPLARLALTALPSGVDVLMAFKELLERVLFHEDAAPESVGG